MGRGQRFIQSASAAFQVFNLPLKGFPGSTATFSVFLSSLQLLSSPHTLVLSPLPLFSIPQHPQVKIHLESWFLSWNEMDQSWAIDFYEVQLNPFCVCFELLHLVHTERSVFWGDYPTPLSSPGFHNVSIVPLVFILLKRKQ